MNPIFDAVRAIAALMVLVGHALGIFTGTSPLWLKQFGVVTFFLLSGFLISQTLHKRLENPASTFTEYAIDRWARIYSGYLPALVLVAAIDGYSIAHFTGVNAETVSRFSTGSFLSNLFMLQAPANTLPFGSAAPFWTVAIEFWIYMFVGLLAFAARDGVGPLRIAAIIGAGIIPIQSYADNNMVLIPWLAGAVAERVIASGIINKIPPTLCAIASGALLGWLVLLVREGERVYGWHSYLLSASIFLLLIGACLRTNWKADSASGIAVAWWASWSYSLYLLHHSIFMDFAAMRGGGVKSMGEAIVIAITFSIVFARFTECHHRQLAAKMKQALLRNGWVRFASSV
jgi:peptidoglycan/LPS O-acetylase OafA/YrhL